MKGEREGGWKEGGGGGWKEGWVEGKVGGRRGEWKKR